VSTSAEKTEAIVIRLADFSESSRVVTLFTRDFGKISALAKGAKRLKGPFEAGLDLLSRCRVVFRPKSGGLDLLTEAQLVAAFQIPSHQITSLYCGYYLAELLDGLTLEHDPHPDLYPAAVQALTDLSSGTDPRLPLFRFQLVLLREIGQLPQLDSCLRCDAPVAATAGVRFWVSQGGIICSRCGRPEFKSTEIHSTAIEKLIRLIDDPTVGSGEPPTPQEAREMHAFLISAVTHVLERRPKMLKYLTF
jgi:DNA repair protein RecO (recombination protein O)